MNAKPTVLIVPGLRDHVEGHWQTLLAEDLAFAGRPVSSVPPMGRADLDCATRVAAIEAAAQAIEGPLIIVAHSGGCVMVAHWAQQTQREVRGAVLATPPDFERPMQVGDPPFASFDEFDVIEMGVTDERFTVEMHARGTRLTLMPLLADAYCEQGDRQREFRDDDGLEIAIFTGTNHSS